MLSVCVQLHQHILSDVIYKQTKNMCSKIDAVIIFFASFKPLFFISKLDILNNEYNHRILVKWMDLSDIKDKFL